MVRNDKRALRGNGRQQEVEMQYVGATYQPKKTNPQSETRDASKSTKGIRKERPRNRIRVTHTPSDNAHQAACRCRHSTDEYQSGTHYTEGSSEQSTVTRHSHATPFTSTEARTRAAPQSVAASCRWLRYLSFTHALLNCVISLKTLPLRTQSKRRRLMPDIWPQTFTGLPA